MSLVKTNQIIDGSVNFTGKQCHWRVQKGYGVYLTLCVGFIGMGIVIGACWNIPFELQILFSPFLLFVSVQIFNLARASFFKQRESLAFEPTEARVVFNQSHPYFLLRIDDDEAPPTALQSILFFRKRFVLGIDEVSFQLKELGDTARLRTVLSDGNHVEIVEGNAADVHRIYEFAVQTHQREASE